MRLTPKSIDAIKPTPQRREISDGGSGLWLIVQPTGAKSWAVRYRHNGRPAKLTLGPWPTIGLAAARKDAAAALYRLTQGVDPGGAKKTAKREAAEAKANTLAAIAGEFLKREGSKLRTLDQRRAILERLILPALGHYPVTAIRRSDIVRMLDHIEDNSGQRTADVALAALRRVMTWHATRTDDFVVPIVRGMGRQDAAAHRRARVLDDHEIRRLWAATADGQQFSNMIRFLLLTTARRGEAAAMTWDEVTGNIWTLPASRSKTKAEIVRPLSRSAQAILAAQPRTELPWIFAPTGRGPLQSFTEPKAKLDAACGVRDWRIHDLRRSARSLLSRANISVDTAERCLGHVVSGVRGVYDRHDHIEQMTHAFEALASLINQIVASPTGADVIALRR
jgi:integrase